MKTECRLSPAQERLYHAIQQFSHDGHAPSQLELAERLGYRSVNAIAESLQILVRKGYIIVNPGKARSIRIVRNDAPPRIIKQGKWYFLSANHSTICLTLRQAMEARELLGGIIPEG